ncbi:hypothetical protein [Arthrobacter sp. zg-Y877]|uniref:hypothetical protein n=1 Tax=Arthrobacter sp. zg-Y877 TaxID=3049074 RepID=UPI0025A35577|nr:hypothetical protein [Arthrobacter sp. zg-Y877]MDM7991629.1 hypothetical protein [Arthrobacter sp. zg-Y877]
MVNEPTAPAWQISAALVGGLALGFCFLRFPCSKPWVSPLVLVLFCGVLLFALDAGELRIAWFGGFAAGTNLGSGWKAMSDQSRKRAQKSAWTVNNAGFDTAAAAREAAGAALRALGGGAHPRLAIEHGSASFQVTGSVKGGLVCHRTHDVPDEHAWAVLVRVGHTLDDPEMMWVDLSMGGFTGSMPEPLINDLGSVELAMDDFFHNPTAVPSGPWVTGDMAEGSRLSTR